MGAVGTLFGILFLFIIIAGGVYLFTNSDLNAEAYLDSILERTTNRVVPTTGEDVCDLKFTIFGAYDQAPFGRLEGNHVYLGESFFGTVFHPEIAQFEFRNCHISGQASLLDLIPQFHNDRFENPSGNFVGVNAQTASICCANPFQPEEFNISMTFIREADGKTLGGAKKFFVSVPVGTFLPFSFQKTYHFDNVPFDDYEVEITSNAPINRLPAGAPFIYNLNP